MVFLLDFAYTDLERNKFLLLANLGPKDTTEDLRSSVLAVSGVVCERSDGDALGSGRWARSSSLS